MHSSVNNYGLSIEEDIFSPTPEITSNMIDQVIEASPRVFGNDIIIRTTWRSDDWHKDNQGKWYRDDKKKIYKYGFTINGIEIYEGATSWQEAWDQTIERLQKWKKALHEDSEPQSSYAFDPYNPYAPPIEEKAAPCKPMSIVKKLLIIGAFSTGILIGNKFYPEIEKLTRDVRVLIFTNNQLK